MNEEYFVVTGYMTKNQIDQLQKAIDLGLLKDFMCDGKVFANVAGEDIYAIDFWL